MLILFDYGTPKGLVRVLSGHTVHTVQAQAWDTLNNGELLRAAEEAGFELLLTTEQLMGHANVDTTLNVYTQVLDGSLRAAADKVGSELFTIVHSPEGTGGLSH